MLTAAHCVYYANKHNKLIPASKIKVWAGGVNKIFMEEFRVKEVIPHKKYDSKKFDYDIALLKVSVYSLF